MGRNVVACEASLFRGWERVRLRYEFDGGHVVVRERHTWSATTETRLPVSDLSRTTHRVWSRQPANWVALVLLLLIGAALGFDLVTREGGIRDGHIDWRLWGPGIGAGTAAWFVLWGTRGRREWTHFPGRDGRTGLYVLRGKRNAEEHRRFVDAVRQQAR